MNKYLLAFIFCIVISELNAQITLIRPDTIEPLNMQVVNGKLLYFHNSNPGVMHYELWVSDGTNAGSHLLKDINPAGTDDLFNWFTTYGIQKYSNCVFNNELYFYADDGVHGMELWKSDGTTAGTNMLIDITPGALGWDFVDNRTPVFCEANGTLFFKAGNSTNGYELWKTDGTASGTSEVKDIFPGATGSNPYFLTSFNGKVYFSAKDDVNGWELFCSDGTTSGTYLVKDIVPGLDGTFNDGADLSINPQFKVSGNYLYFLADNDGITPVQRHWWRTDGTAVGTIQLETNLVPQDPGPYNFNITTADLNGEFVFIAAGGTTSSKFWKSDGTVPGTVEVITNNGLSLRPSILSNGNYIYFNGSDNDSSGLAMSDGTTNGSEMIYNYVEAGTAFNIQNPSYLNGNMYFHITKYYQNPLGAHERILQTDGTNAGTIIYPKVEPLSKLIPFGNNLIFYGHDTTEAVPELTNLYLLHPFGTPTGISETENDQLLKVFPNPVTTQLTISDSGFDLNRAEINFIDLTGRVIYKQQLNNGNIKSRTIDVPEYVCDGLYLINVKDILGMSKTARVIIQNNN